MKQFYLVDGKLRLLVDLSEYEEKIKEAVKEVLENADAEVIVG